MEFEWDSRKSAANLLKHGIHFADAALVLEDDLALTMRDRSAFDEDRWVSLGTDALGRVLVMVYTWRGDKIRIISARPATPRERRQYEEQR